jgi:2-keto-4-pentenoate hydratase
MTSLHDTALALALARKSGEKLPEYPGAAPPDLDAAFALQNAVSRALGWTARGWKVGATNPIAQTLLGISEPFAAPLFAERTFDSRAHVGGADSNSRIIEPEIAFVLRDSIPIRETPYSLAEVLAAVASVHPAIELVNPRLPLGLKEPITWTIADGGINDAFVLGPGHAPLPPHAYKAIQARALQNGSVVTEGAGTNVLGGPELVLTWTVNHLASKGLALQAGDIITTGVVTNILLGQRGDEITAEFSDLGHVSVQL